MSVEILVVSYNKSNLIQQLIQSYFKYNYNKYKLHIIDGSIIKEEKEKIKEICKNNNIKLTLFDYNIHHGPGLHYGILKSDSTYLFLMDSDALFIKEGLIEKLLIEIENHFGIGKIEYVNKDGWNVEKSNNSINYLHPNCCLISKEKYLSNYSLRLHGAPFITTMSKLNTTLKEFIDLNNYVNRGTQGTCKEFGYNLKHEKISVIMASYLGEYPRCAKNREEKFHRAIKSFLNQTYIEKELIIVSDGCQKTIELYEKYYKDYNNILLVKIPKQILFSGQVRNHGILNATGKYISYLDNDDFIIETHLENIISQFTEDVNWVYYDDFLLRDFNSLNSYSCVVRPNWIESCHIGTSTITHLNYLDVFWGDGYGHDWRFIEQINNNFKNKKINNTGYIVCHQPGIFDL